MRLGLWTSSGAALPFIHMALPVGWEWSARIATSMSRWTVFNVPQRDLQRVQ
jgi:hypothetical protein